MPRTFFDLNLLANMVAKLGNIVGEHVKFDMFANNVGQFGHTFTPLVSVISNCCIAFNQHLVEHSELCLVR